jgi:tetratricopeptide (TPR) repeat protein
MQFAPRNAHALLLRMVFILMLMSLAIVMPTHAQDDIANPTTPEGWVLAGDEALANYEPFVAIESYESALALDASYVPALLGRASAWEFLEENELARLDYDSAIAQGETIEALLDRAHFLRQQGELDAALADVNNALALDDASSRAYQIRAYIYRDQGLLQEALVEMNTSVDLAPEDPASYVARGNFFAFFNDFENAIRNYDAALLFDEFYAPAYRQRGNAYGAEGNWTNAILDFERALELTPNDPDAYFLRGNLFGALGEFEGAIEDFTRVIEINPFNIDAYRMRADSNRIRAASLEEQTVSGVDYDAFRRLALEDYGIAIERNPDDDASYFGRALTYAQLGEAELALADFDVVLEGVPPEAVPAELQTILDDLRSQVGE